MEQWCDAVNRAPRATTFAYKIHGNTSQFDWDESKTATTWVEEEKHGAAQCYMDHGVAIVSRHGRAVEWDSNVMSHYSSIPDPGEGNNYHGITWGCF
jgi:hypothetical protein